MPEKKSMTAKRLFTLLLAYAMFCVAGGVVASGFLLPGVFAANSLIRTLSPNLKAEGIDFSIADLPQASNLYAADGSKIATFYTQNRTVVPLDQISEVMQKAVVAREDRRFWDHSGVDVQGVLRAFVQTYVKGDEQQGGSTLTQQYVKNVLAAQAEEDNDPIAAYHAKEDTIARKLREMLISVQLEREYSKGEILQGYLNIAQFGNRSIYGVEAAAHRYFDKSAKDLNVVESATIAAITKNPANYDPSIEANQEESQNQRNIVLKLMLQQGFISQQEYDDAVNTPLKDTLHITSVAQGCMAAGDAAFFCSYVVKQIENSPEFGATKEERQKLLNSGGLEIHTTMDVNANNAAMNAAKTAIPVDDPSHFEVMIAAIRPGTGEVLGFGINRIYDATSAAEGDETRTAVNYAVDERDGGGSGFPIGSTWKPINLVAWMREGHAITEELPAVYALNEEHDVPDYYAKGITWNVQNSGGVRVSSESPLNGLINSHNTTQAAMLKEIGLTPILNAASDMGYHSAALADEDKSLFDQKTLYNPPVVIGSGVSASALTMANVYATIAANGVQCTPIAITKVVDSTGKDIPVPSANCHQAIDPEIAQTAAYAMNQGVVQPKGQAHDAQLDNNRKTFAKTGTNENTYMLTGGFTPEVAAYTMVGNAEGYTYQEDKKTGIWHATNAFSNRTINGVYHDTWYGADIATPAWKNFMNTYLAAANIPINNDYGNPSSKYVTATTSSTSRSKSSAADESQSDAAGQNASPSPTATATASAEPQATQSEAPAETQQPQATEQSTESAQ
ncbi:transglycosylase domain-containing protein [Bifidobacterium moraviense]|nr:transglycosylase domain-containing protein [Bifidobacterium sp. DSM 109958]